MAKILAWLGVKVVVFEDEIEVLADELEVIENVVEVPEDELELFGEGNITMG